MTTPLPRNTDDPVKVLVVDPAGFSRACTVAGLRGVDGMSIESCAELDADQEIDAPDILLFQIAEPISEESLLFMQLAIGMRRWPGSAALVVGDHITVDQMLAAIAAGTRGLLPATASVESIHLAIQLILDGLVIYPIEIAETLKLLAATGRDLQDTRISRPVLENGRTNVLTKRQQDVLQLLALGSSNKMIAQTLNISESTVKVHIRAIMMQHGVSNRTQIVAQFLKKNGDEH